MISYLITLQKILSPQQREFKNDIFWFLRACIQEISTLSYDA